MKLTWRDLIMLACGVGVIWIIWFKPPEYPEGNYLKQIEVIQSSQKREANIYKQIINRHENWDKIDTSITNNPILDSMHNEFLHRTGFSRD